MINYLENLALYIQSECIGTDIGTDITLYRLYALLARTKAPNVTSEDVHDAWVTWMLGVDQTHPWLIPYDELLDEQKWWDEPYRDVINRSGKVAMEYTNGAH